MRKFLKAMHLSSRTEFTSKYTSIIIINLSTTKRPSPMWSHYKPKRLEFETELGHITSLQIQKLLSIKVEQPTNLAFDKMKYEFS